ARALAWSSTKTLVTWMRITGSCPGDPARSSGAPERVVGRSPRLGQRNVRCGVAGHDAGQPRVGFEVLFLPYRHEAGALVELEGARMVEVAGVDRQTVDPGAPGDVDRRAEQERAEPASRELRHQAEQGDLRLGGGLT